MNGLPFYMNQVYNSGRYRIIERNGEYRFTPAFKFLGLLFWKPINKRVKPCKSYQECINTINEFHQRVVEDYGSELKKPLITDEYNLKWLFDFLKI